MRRVELGSNPFNSLRRVIHQAASAAVAGNELGGLQAAPETVIPAAIVDPTTGLAKRVGILDVTPLDDGDGFVLL